MNSEVHSKKPRVALLGEFSAGKSTLANLLLGRSQSPVRVTATQMPPLWYQFGTDAPVRVCDDETEELLPEAEGEDLDVPLHETKAIRVPVESPILRRFDLLDMPGSSDPNMAPDTWDALLPEIDIAIWCTPATQAWRQSEAAIWDNLPSTLHQRSLLLLTRMDKISQSDRPRVLNRVRAETDAQFRHILPVALLSAKEPPASCTNSGMAQVMEALDDVLTNAAPPAPALPVQPTRNVAANRPAPKAVAPRRVASLPGMRGQRRRSPNHDVLI